MFPADIYLITDRKACRNRSLVVLVEEALQAGVGMLQYREKDLSFREREKIAVQLKILCEQYGATFLINDDVELAKATGAKGVHVGQTDLSPKEVRKMLGEEVLVGVTVRTLSQALRAEGLGANYLGLGPVFRSETKQVAEPLGCGIVRMIRSRVHIPVYAIGGINLQNAAKVIQAGADGLAMVSSILNHPRVGERVQAFIRIIREAKNSKFN